MFKDIKAFLISSFQKIKSKKILKRYPWLVLICLLTVLIPIILGISYANIMQRAEQEELPNIAISLYDAKGNTLGSSEIRKDIISGSPLVKIFYDLATSKVKADKPTGFNRNQNFVFVVSDGSENKLYKCYFDEDYSKSYLEDESGQFYSPDTIAYSNFMNSKFSEKVYLQSVPPALSTSGKDLITPSTVEWSYHLENEKIARSENYETTENILTYRISGALDFKFSRIPDKTVFKVKNSHHEIIFTGSAEELYSLTAKEGDELLIDLEAYWDKSDDLNAFGKQTYSFKIICSEPSEFSISSNTVYGGEFIILSVSDVERVDSIIYNVIKPAEETEETAESDNATMPSVSEEKEDTEESEKALTQLEALKELYSFTPTFISNSGNAYAFLLIPADIGNTSLSFSLSCGISKEEFTVKIKESPYVDKTVLPVEEDRKILVSEEEKQAFSRLLASTEHTYSPIYFREKFLSPEEYGLSKIYSFNDKIIYNEDSFKLCANIYSTDISGGTSIRSANIGKVTASASSPLLGNYVVVDHGMGLYTWYCGLSTVNVSVGDILKKGDSVGISGSSRLCDKGVSVFCTINGTLIHPDAVLGNTVINNEPQAKIT